MAGPILAEPTCKHFCLYSDVNNDDTFMLVEEWVSQEALEEHIRSDESHRILIVIELASHAPEISFKTVSDIAGFELIESLRTQHTSAAQI
jgi:quinol monooxygenase YgiN